MTDFQISDRRYYLLTAASIYLIFHYLILSLSWTRQTLDFVLSNDFNFMNVLLLLSLCAVYLTFISYFSFYDLRLLKALSVAIIFFEICAQTIPFVADLPESLLSGLTIATIILEMIWFGLVLRLEPTKYRVVKTLKLYAKMWLLALILTVLFTVLMTWTDFPALFAPQYFFLVLPNVVLLRFAGRLRDRGDTQMARP